MQSITLNQASTSNLKTSTISNYSGLLNSDYKTIVKANFKSFKSPSLFNVKQRVKSNQLQTYCSVGTGLKVLMFLIAIIIAFI